jgi:asparagine synthase (glutamine-hydrolysing)
LEHLRSEASPYPAQVEAFRNLFFDACRLRLRSDVPIGTAVSGGLDSSSVLAAVNTLGAESVARRPVDWSRAFTIVAPGTAHDELDYAMAACETARVQPTVIDLFARADPDDLDEYLYLTEGTPLTNLPAWYLYRSMREHGIKVSLDGQGADEILAGYAWDVARILQLEGAWLRRPRRTLDLVVTLAALARNSPYNPMSAKAIALSSSPLLRRLLSLIPGLRASVPRVFSTRHDEATWQEARTLAPVNSILFMAINDSIQNLLQRYDLLSMSSGLEIRMPFLDWRLVSYTLSLPGRSIIGNGFTKRILRDAMAAHLPAKVRTRKPKLQFQGPIRPLLTGALKPWLDAHPELRELAGDLTAPGRNVREIGLALVAAWKEKTFPALAGAKIAALHRQKRADPGLVAQEARGLH